MAQTCLLSPSLNWRDSDGLVVKEEIHTSFLKKDPSWWAWHPGEWGILEVEPESGLETDEMRLRDIFKGCCPEKRTERNPQP